MSVSPHLSPRRITAPTYLEYREAKFLAEPPSPSPLFPAPRAEGESDAPPARFTSHPHKKPGKQTKLWAFTAWLDKQPVSLSPAALTFDLKEVASVDWQVETCPTSNRKHIQGCIELKRKVMDFNVVKGYIGLGPSTHVSSCFASKEANLTYVTKPETRSEGPYHWPKPVCPLDRPGPKIIFYMGPPGVGKTYDIIKGCWDTYGVEPYRVNKAKNSNGAWIGDYQGQPVVLMDELEYDWFSEAQWKLVFERHPTSLPSTAGGKYIDWCPKEIHCTINNQPHPFFFTEAMMTRITEFKFLNRAQHSSVKRAKLDFDPTDPAFLALPLDPKCKRTKK